MSCSNDRYRAHEPRREDELRRELLEALELLRAEGIPAAGRALAFLVDGVAELYRDAPREDACRIGPLLTQLSGGGSSTASTRVLEQVADELRAA